MSSEKKGRREEGTKGGEEEEGEVKEGRGLRTAGLAIPLPVHLAAKKQLCLSSPAVFYTCFGAIKSQALMMRLSIIY